MSNHNTLIIKTVHNADFPNETINKTFCSIDPYNTAKLLSHLDLTANPRKAKKNNIVNSIHDTLGSSPELMTFKTKGLLIACHHLEVLQRGRYGLTFVDEIYTDGLLDGGHNALAVGIYILEEYFIKNDIMIPREVRSIKHWDDFQVCWKEYEKEVLDFASTLDFTLPIEIIHPAKGHEDSFAEAVFEISDARNNNNSLTLGAMAHHKGHYDILKKYIDEDIVNDIEWKDGEANKYIKRDDIVALSLIPIIALQKAGGLDNVDFGKFNPVNIYSGKRTCTKAFSNLIEATKLNDGDVDDVVLPEFIESALALMKDIPYLYDLIYLNFPKAYNNISPGFGRITKVRETKEKHSKTKFYKLDSDYSYPDGFIVPIVASLSALIGYDGNRVYWKVDNIRTFVKNNLVNHSEMIVKLIKTNDYNPQNFGKSGSSYEAIEMQFEFAEMKSRLDKN